MTTQDSIVEAKVAVARGDFDAAIAALRPLTEAGDREARYRLGFLALTECELISGAEAFALLRAAAEQGHPDAMYQIATFPEFATEGFKSPLSDEEAWRWLLRAAEAGCVEAQRNAGAHLATGEWRGRDAGDVDLKAAVGWYRRAAESGHADAQFNLATMLMNGDGPDPFRWTG